MSALHTTVEVRAEILTMIGAASDNALDDTLSKNDRRVFIVVATMLSDLLGKIAIATEAGTAETPKNDSVHEGAGPQDIAQPLVKGETNHG